MCSSDLVIRPRYQYPAEELKTDYSKTPVPVGRAMALRLAAHLERWPSGTLLTGLDGGQLSTWALERAVRAARAKVRKCAGCGEVLFDASSKFDAHCGWPSFSVPFDPEKVEEHRDTTHGMVRTEVTCRKCGGHLGHVFDDGPAPTGLRYCINSASIQHEPPEN